MVKKNKAYFTACSLNYIDKAVASLNSVHLYDEAAEKFILIVDKKRKITCNAPHINIVWAEDINYPDFYKAAFKYDIIELNTALKPFFTINLLKEYKFVVYLDPDTFLFSNMNPLFEKLERHSVILTPHSTQPIEDNFRPNIIDFMRFGIFNLGFYAVNNDLNAKTFLEWWHKMCIDNCYYEPNAGLGVDQKFVDLAPSLFNGVYILKDPGYNLAFWNLHYRNISKKEDKFYVNDLFPLKFVHFSSYDDTNIDSIAVKQTRFAKGSRPDFAMVSKVYRKELLSANKILVIDDNSYGFSNFQNGDKLTPALRRFYSISEVQHLIEDPNPFKSKNVHRYAKINNLLDSSISPDQYRFYEVDNLNSKKKILVAIFYILFKCLGSKRYFLINKFFASYSSLLSQFEIRDFLDKRYAKKAKNEK